MEVARIALIDEKNPIIYLEKATQAARKLDCSPSVSAEDLDDARTTLKQFEELVCEPFALEMAKAALDLLPEMAVVARASAALGLAADYCEHAAETLEKVRQLALDSANCLAKEVPAKMATWRGELQSKAMLKTSATKVLSSGYSLLLGPKKAVANSEPNKDQAGVFSSEEEDLARRDKVRPYLLNFAPSRHHTRRYSWNRL